MCLKSPSAPNPAGVTQKTLGAQINMAPAMFGANSQFSPLYSQLNLDNLFSFLNGSDPTTTTYGAKGNVPGGTVTTPGNPGFHPLYQNSVMPALTTAQIVKVIGSSPQRDYSAHELLDLASRTYHVFHLIVEEGSFARGHLSGVRASWQSLLGQRALSLKDHTKLAQGIVAIIEQNEAALGRGVVSTARKELPGYVALLPA